MIVLDEQLLGRDIEGQIGAWYAGSVVFVTALRPGTVIKDDAIPRLLRRQSQPTFVTINERDFWRKVPINEHFCVVCLTLPDARAGETSQVLRMLFRHAEFSTKTLRMGKVIRVTHLETSYYTYRDPEIKRVT